jgi:hypothetical protein
MIIYPTSQFEMLLLAIFFVVILTYLLLEEAFVLYGYSAWASRVCGALSTVGVFFLL